MRYDTFFQAQIWSCLSCGFIYEGGQPKMECPVCASYKANFVDFPQHLEAQLREEFPKLPPNHREVRAKRLELIKKFHIRDLARVHGRVLPGESGSNIDDTSEDRLS